MPLKPEKIKLHRDCIAKADSPEMAIMYIAKHDAEITVPIVMAVLQQLHAKIPPDDQATLTAVNEALKVFDRADYYQNLNLVSLASKLDEVKVLIKTGLDVLLAQVQHVTVSEALLPLWHEARILLEGLHQRVFQLIKKGADGLPLKEKGAYLAIDMADTVFRKVTGLTKYDIALYYHRTAEMIKAKIDDCHREISARRADHSAMKVLHEDESAITFEVKIPKASAARFRDMCAAFLEHPENVHIFSAENLQGGISSADFVSVLSAVDAQDEQVKIKTLHTFFEKNGLTQAQCDMLMTLRHEIEAALKSYLNTPTYTSYLFSKVHASLVSDVLTQLSLSHQPADHLKQLFEMRKQLISDNSGLLLPKINRLILDVFSMLSSHAKVEHEKHVGEKLKQEIRHANG